MELRYKRRMRMPIRSLPGFSDGLDVLKINEALGLTKEGFDTQRIRQGAANLGFGDWTNNNASTVGPIMQLRGLSKDIPSTELGLSKNATGGGPSTSGGKAGSKGTVDPVAIATSAVGFAGSAMDAFRRVLSEQDMLNRVGTTTANGNGYGYLMQNDIDTGAEKAQVSAENKQATMQTTASGAQLGGSIGMAFGPVGGAIGTAAGAITGLATGLFGAGRRKRQLLRRIYNALLQVIRTNNYNLAGAISDAYLNDYMSQYGNSQDLLIYAKFGKDASRTNKLRMFNRKLTLPNMNINE